MSEVFGQDGFGEFVLVADEETLAIGQPFYKLGILVILCRGMWYIEHT
jgi:hypothetical protein